MSRFVLPACIAMLVGVASVESSVAQQPGPAVAATEDARSIVDRYGKLPLYFEPVEDSTATGRTFIARAAHYLIAVSKEGARLALRPRPSDPLASATLELRFVNVDARASVAGADPQDARIHRFGSATGKTHVDMPTFGSVVVSGVYAGVDAVFHGNGRALEYDLVVAPAADPSSILLRVDGASQVSIDDDGDLALVTAVGVVKVQRPVAYQQTPQGRVAIESRFVLAGARDVRIAIGAYDTSWPLTVDPVVSYATWLGGIGGEQANAVAVDAAGNAYVAGWTTSTDFPLATPYDRTLSKYDTDAFVSKLNAAGTALVWSTYLGGSSNSTPSTDRAVGIAIDVAGNTYVIGTTSGSDFPVTANAYQKGSGGGSFVAKLGPAGNALVYSTYLLGVTASGIAVDASSNAYVAGSATSSFATTPGALRTVAGSGSTGFVLKLNATGSAPVFATYLGGTGGDAATSIAVDAQGNAFVGGWTWSSDFPLVNALQATARGGKEGFVAKVDATGARLVYATLLGGALDDQVNAIAIDGKGSAYVAGETYSWDFPVKNGFQMQKAGARLVNSSVGNAFVAKLEPAGNALAYGSFLGGEVCLSLCQIVFGGGAQYRGDAAYAIAVDAAGHAHVAGIARTYTFPLVDSSARRMRDDTEDSAFVSKVSISGSTLLWSTFTRTGFHEADNGLRFPLGAATGVAVDTAGNAYVAGDADTYSDFQATAGAFQTTGTGVNTAIVVKFGGAPAMALTTSNARTDTQTPVTLTATLSGAPLSGTLTFLADGVPIGASVPFSGTSASATTTLPAGVHALSAVLRSAGVASDTPVVDQVVDLALACSAP